LNEIAEKRLSVLRETEDGFAIAEADFKLRGPGDMLGLRQSGIPEFRVLSLPGDANLIGIAHDGAKLRAARGSLHAPVIDVLVDLLAPRALARED
jgi:ATP-dependent DNA helicase RecG